MIKTVAKERKQVTVLFADLVGFTAMTDQMDPEDVDDMMNTLRAPLYEVIINHGGVVSGYTDSEIRALFGAPIAQEDDPERAIWAAMAMQDELAAFCEIRQVSLSMRIGINTGLALLKEMEGTGEYTAGVKAVNLVDQLKDAAPVGEILISHDAYRHVRDIFEVQSLEPVVIGGKTEPIQVYVVQGAKARPFHTANWEVEGIETRMVGRDSELRRLQDAWYDVLEDGKSQVVTVVGDAGVGKSRLLCEFDKWEELPNMVPRFRGLTAQQASNMPYSLIRDLFSRRFEILDSDAAVIAREKLERGIITILGAGPDSVEKAHFIGELIGFDFAKGAESPYLWGIAGDSQQLHDRAFHYVAQFFAAVTRDSPAMIYLEDIHWADDGSLDLIDHLARECRDASLLIIALTRPGLFDRQRPKWGEGWKFHTRLKLHPLSDRYTRHLVEEILRKVEGVPEDLQNLIVRKAEGNPFYVEELTKMLIEDGVIVKGTRQWRVEMEQLARVQVPPTLTGVLQARLDRLSAFEQGTLQQASVVGKVFWDEAVKRIHKYASELRDRSSAQVVNAGGKVGTRTDNGIPIDDSTDGRNRKRKVDSLRHLLAEEMKNLRLIQERQSEYVIETEIPLQLIKEERQKREDIEKLKQSIEGLEQLYRNDALEVANDTSPALDALEEKELILRRETSTFEGTREYTFKQVMQKDVIYESILKSLRRVYHAQVAAWLIEHSGERVGEHAGKIGEHYESSGDKKQAATWYGRAGRQAQNTYDLETALGYYQKALALEEHWEWRKGEVEVLHILGRRDEERTALKALEATSRAPAYDVGYLWGQYYEMIGEYPQAQEAVKQALDACRNEDAVVRRACCLAQLGLIARRQGDYKRAKQRYVQAQNLFPRGNRPSIQEAQTLAQTLNGLGTVYRQLGDFDRSKACYERALNLNDGSGNHVGEAKALNNLGVTAFYQRRFFEANSYHRQALEIRRAIGDKAGEGESLNNLAQVASDMGNYGQAQDYLSAAITIYQITDDRWNEANAWNSMGIIYQELGDLCKAATCLQRSLKLSQEIGDEAGQVYTRGSLGLVMRDQGNLQAAEKLLSDGLNLAQMQADKYLVSLFLSHLGIVSLRAGKVDQAINYANDALNMRREMDLQLWTTADLTTLAAAHMASNAVERALDYAHQALTILDKCNREGPESPQRDYFVCSQVLFAARCEKEARAALQSAYDLVIERAEKIADPTLHHSFLERVPINSEIVQEYERCKQGHSTRGQCH